MSQSSSFQKLYRLSPHPYAFFWIACGACGPIALVFLYEMIRGNKEAYQMILFFLAICALQWILCAVNAKRNYVVASETNICLCCKGKQTQLTWNDIRMCGRISILGTQIIVLYYRLSEQCNGIIRCRFYGKNRAFIEKMIDLYHIPSNMG